MLLGAVCLPFVVERIRAVIPIDGPVVDPIDPRLVLLLNIGGYMLEGHHEVAKFEGDLPPLLDDADVEGTKLKELDVALLNCAPIEDFSRIE